ncbi:hypothetical protein HYH02_011528 [Chlamydomonas schloesseri]|uniref:Uncharacterized protein n=1 Tax=Chlamydomonas schloesseri TaxID=2026947 RepID=A0A835T3C7_9CHLO|nr:hypothetical protein HYH02_011528 [Chlamydomonas schloesseri]|eukprot:KAG2436591.1 hypothetical protein HYH02_011528 [Chlamydomonas schloesseri]
MSCDCSINISFSMKKQGDPHVRCVMWTLGLIVAGSIILFGALGSIQNECGNQDPTLLAGVNGFSSVLSCKKLYRYYWFITALAFVTAIYGLWVSATGALATSRGAVMGLLVVACLLTINMTEAFYGVMGVDKFENGTARDRSRTMYAGCIITAVFQAFGIIVVGMEQGATEEAAAKPVKEAVKQEKVAKKEIEVPAAAPAPAAEPVPAPAAEPAAEAAPAVALTVQEEQKA